MPKKSNILVTNCVINGPQPIDARMLEKLAEAAKANAEAIRAIAEMGRGPTNWIGMQIGKTDDI